MLIAEGRRAEAESCIVFEPNYYLSPESVAHQLRQPHTPPAKRGWSDWLYARQAYEPADVVHWVQTDSGYDHFMLESVTVERGIIRYKWGCRFKEWTAQGK
jgi:hypothetical protein